MTGGVFLGLAIVSAMSVSIIRSWLHGDILKQEGGEHEEEDVQTR